MDSLPLYLQFDIELFWLINLARSAALDGFFAIVTNLGSGWVAIPIVGIIALIKTPRSSRVHALVFIGLSMTVSGLFNSGIKYAVKRPRPLRYFGEIRQQRQQKLLEQGLELPDNPGRESLIPHVVGPRWKYRSFPSGHANTAFSAAMILYLFYGGPWILSFAVALLVTYSRVYVGVHFPLDTVAGAILGAAVTSVVFALYSTTARDFTPSRQQR